MTLLGEVDEPARRADDDLDTALQGLDLWLERAAAVDREDTDSADLAGVLEVTGDLNGELAGGGDRQGLGLSGGLQGPKRLVLGTDHPLDHGYAEPQRLAGAGLGLTDDVVAAKGNRQGHRLDREGVDDAGLCERVHDVGVDVEVGKRGFRRRRNGGGLRGGVGDGLGGVSCCHGFFGGHEVLSIGRGPHASEVLRRTQATLQSGPIGVLRGCSQLHWLLIRADRAPMSGPSLAASTTVCVHGRRSRAEAACRWTRGRGG
jgi:hypothetical protein